MEQIAGTSIDIDLTLQDDQGSPQNLTGATMTWHLARAYSVPAVLTVADATINVDDAINGSCIVPLVDTDTADLQGTYYHWIEADFGGGSAKKWKLGTITFTEN